MRRERFLLFRIYRHQDARAYEELYDIYYERIRRFVYFKLPSGEDVDGIAAEVFLRAWEYATASHVEQAGSLLYRMARNIVADYYRSREDTSPIEEAANVESSTDIVEEVAVAEEYAELIKTLRTMKEEYQEVLTMKYLDEMTTKEIAVALDKSPNNVRVLLYRAKKALTEATTH